MHGLDTNNNINLNIERMPGLGELNIDNFKVNLLYGLNDLCMNYIKPTDIILELGSHIGISTELFSLYAKKVVTVDKIKQNEIDSLLERKKNIKFVESTFDDFLRKCQIKFDLIYIDGKHTYNNVVNDIKHSLCCIKSDGIICGHDMSDFTPDVERAVSTFFDREKVKIFSDSSWLVQL